MFGQGKRYGHQVFDLRGLLVIIYHCEERTYIATVELLSHQVLEVQAVVIRQSSTCKCFSQKAFPDTPSLICAKGIIVDLEVDSASDSIINMCDPIGRQEHNALVIFKRSQEYTDYGIASYL